MKFRIVITLVETHCFHYYVKNNLEAHDPVASVAFNKSDLPAVHCSKKGTLQIWNTVRWALVKQLPNLYQVVPSLAFIRNKGLAAGFANGCLRFWDTATWKVTNQKTSKSIKKETLYNFFLKFFLKIYTNHSKPQNV